MKAINRNRRQFLKYSGVGLAGLLGLSLKQAGAAAPYKVVVIGGGFAGATAAKYLKMWGGDSVDVTLVEPKSVYYSPILSNLVLNGQSSAKNLAFTYADLQRKYRVTHKAHRALTINSGANKTVLLENNETLAYDRLIVAPGIDFKYVNDYDINKVPHAWQGGEQVELLRSQIEAMNNGDTFVMTVPPTPYRCPPGPYERACVVAHWLNQHRPGAKVVVLDANPDIIVEKESFGSRFTQYGVEYHAGVQVTQVDDASKTVTVSGAPEATYAADVLNVIPAMRAGANALLDNAGLLSGDWAPVSAKTFESTEVAGIHVIGDAQGTGVPKAGHIGNAEAKVCAEAVLNLLHGFPVYASPKINSACYSPVSTSEATWLTATYEYSTVSDSWVAIAPSKAGGAPAVSHYQEMFGWTNNLFSDTFS